MIPYDATRTSLFHPGDATDFFQHGPLASDAAVCAEMARVAYVKREDDLRVFLVRAGFALVKFADVDGSQAFIASRAGDAVVAFRGTEPDDPTDLVADVGAALVSWPAGGRVHGGFAHALDVVWAAIEPAIPPAARVVMTGHSLGAALATLAATRRRPDHLFTFGSPRVGDAVFARLSGGSHDRYVDCADIVTRVPPGWMQYEHTGTLRYIDRHGAVRPGIGDGDIEADCREARVEYIETYTFKHGTVAVRDLADHTPVNYVSGVAGLRA